MANPYLLLFPFHRGIKKVASDFWWASCYCISREYNNYISDIWHCIKLIPNGIKNVAGDVYMCYDKGYKIIVNNHDTMWFKK